MRKGRAAAAGHWRAAELCPPVTCRAVTPHGASWALHVNSCFFPAVLYKATTTSLRRPLSQAWRSPLPQTAQSGVHHRFRAPSGLLPQGPGELALCISPGEDGGSLLARASAPPVPNSPSHTLPVFTDSPHSLIFPSLTCQASSCCERFSFC